MNIHYSEALSRVSELAEAATLVVQEALGEQAHVLLEFRETYLQFQAQVQATFKSLTPGAKVWVTQHSGVIDNAALDEVLGSDLERLGRTDVGMRSIREESYEILKELLALDQACVELETNRVGQLFGHGKALYFERGHGQEVHFFRTSSISYPRERHWGWSEEKWRDREQLGAQAWAKYQARAAAQPVQMPEMDEEQVPVYLAEFAQELEPVLVA